MSYHVILIDGTHNGKDDVHSTNVLLMSRLLNKDHHQIHYYEGPGNDETNKIDHWLKGAFGYDCLSIRNHALEDILKIYKPDDKIAVIGFSRGAASARMICHQLAKRNIKVEFLGCFDTVLAMLPFGRAQQVTLFGNLHVSPLVKQARHAVALNEDRAAFAPNLMNARPGVKEVWFKGCHADIGGGYKLRGLADVTLHWMVNEAKQSGLLFDDLPPIGLTHQPHSEKLPLRRKVRRVGVMVDGGWTTRPAQYF